MPSKVRTKRSFGGIRKLPSGRYQANYTAPDQVLYNAPWTFQTRGDAEAWLVDQRRTISLGAWQPPTTARAAPLTFGEYADAWLRDRKLKDRTRSHYRQILHGWLNPTFGDMALKNISPESVRRWHATVSPNKPTMRAHSYGLLRTILSTAVGDQLIPVNPATIRGAGNSTRVHRVKPATLTELEALVAAMPAKYRAMVLLASWCGMRFGELAELRRFDLNLRTGVIQVRRGVVRVDGRTLVTTPKSDAGVRDIAIPPHLVPVLKQHIEEHAEWGRDGLVFPAAGGKHLAPSTLYKSYYAAREAAGRPDLRFHDLRHTGAVLAASTGATLAELMGRLGHSTPAAAMRYQHAAQGRDAQIAAALSALVEGGAK